MRIDVTVRADERQSGHFPVEFLCDPFLDQIRPEVTIFR